MADPFDLFGGNDATKSSTIDDDFDALFGPVGGDSKQENEQELDLSDFLKPTPASLSTDGVRTSGVDSTQDSASPDPPTDAGEPNKGPDVRPEGNNDLVDFGCVDDLVQTSSTPGNVEATTSANPNPKTLDKDKLFSFDDGDPGLQDVLFPSSSTASRQTESSSVLNDNDNHDQQSSTIAHAPNRDIFEDIFSPKSNNPAPKQETIHSLDDIFATSSSDDKPETEDSLTDIFAPKTREPSNKRKSDALADSSGESLKGKGDDLLEDIFMMSSNPQKAKPPVVDENASNATPSFSTDVFLTDLSLPAKSTDGETLDNRVVAKDNKSLSADLLADLPGIESTPANTAAIAPEVEFDGIKSSAVASVVEDHVVVADEKGRRSRMDQEQEGITEGGMDNKPRAAPDILDFLGNTAAACPDLPDISTLESSSSTRATDQLDLLSHPSSASDIFDEGDDVGPSKRDHGADSNAVKKEEEDVEPTKAKKKKEDANDEDEKEVVTPGNVKLSVTAPSFDLVDPCEPGEKDEGVGDSKSSVEQKNAERNEKSKKLKEDIQKESEFMDFSVLEMPGEAQLNVDVSKHKRTLSKKGSMALRKKPSRRAIRSTGTDGDDALFQDSTEPKPPVVSDDEDDTTTNEKQQDVFESGDRGQSSGLGDSARGPSKLPMTGGVKIPGLLEGLKKSKSFKSPELKKTDTSTTADAKKMPEKEEHNFRSLLKPAPSSSISSSSSASATPSKSLKDSQNQSIAQIPSSIKPSDLRRQPMAGSVKLPALIKSSSPADRVPNKPQSPASKVPPPVAIKPKPSLPGAKPRLSPIVKAGQTTSLMTSATSSSSSSSSASPSICDQEKKLQANTSATEVVEDIKVTDPLISTSDKLSIDTTATTTTPSPSTLKNSTLFSPATTSPSPSNILSSIRPKPYTPPKPRPRPSPTTKPSSLPDSKPSSKMQKSGASDNEKQEEDSSDMLLAKNTEKTDLTTKTRTSSSSSLENSQDNTDGSMTKPRKSSISGVWAVQSPIGPDRSTPRKSSISGTAYAPMGFKRSVSNEGTDKSDDKPEYSLKDNDSTASASKSRTSSIAESSEKEKDTESSEKDESKVQETEDSTEDSNGIFDKLTTIEDKDCIKQKDNRMNEVNSEISNKGSSNTNDKPETPQKPMWGVQLRKVDRKPPTPSKPPIDQTKEVESPASWRQQLANKRKSITPKADPPSKEPESNVPEWAKASIERRKRLLECGVIKSEAK